MRRMAGKGEMSRLVYGIAGLNGIIYPLELGISFTQPVQGRACVDQTLAGVPRSCHLLSGASQGMITVWGLTTVKQLR